MIVGSWKDIGRAKGESLLVLSFENFIRKVKFDLTIAREFFKQFGSPKFISIMHDGWDALRAKLLGISIAWICPRTFKLKKIAVALIVCNDGTSEGQTLAILKALARYGIEQEDLLSSVNDTCNSATLTAELLTGTRDGGCSMHSLNLALDHAFGKRTRSLGGTIVDEFKPGDKIIQSGRKLAL
jgi:hypothetical protein